MLYSRVPFIFLLYIPFRTSRIKKMKNHESTLHSRLNRPREAFGFSQSKPTNLLPHGRPHPGIFRMFLMPEKYIYAASEKYRSRHHHCHQQQQQQEWRIAWSQPNIMQNQNIRISAPALSGRRTITLWKLKINRIKDYVNSTTQPHRHDPGRGCIYGEGRSF